MHNCVLDVLAESFSFLRDCILYALVIVKHIEMPYLVLDWLRYLINLFLMFRAFVVYDVQLSVNDVLNEFSLIVTLIRGLYIQRVGVVYLLTVAGVEFLKCL